MKADNNKPLEKFADKMMKETSVENPSANFTASLMVQVEAAEISRPIVYKPLISKTAWVLIFIAVAGLTGYVITNSQEFSLQGVIMPDLQTVTENMMRNLTAYKFSTISLYASGLLTIMLFVQISLLKNLFNKR